MPHICVIESGQYWFRWWLVAYSPPSHYLNQCYVIIIGPLGTNFSELLILKQRFSFTKMHLYISSAKWRPFSPGELSWYNRFMVTVGIYFTPKVESAYTRADFNMCLDLISKYYFSHLPLISRHPYQILFPTLLHEMEDQNTELKAGVGVEIVCTSALISVRCHRQAVNRSSYGFFMMTSSNGNIFHVTGPLCGEFTGHRWIPLINASDAELWYFLWSPPE